MKECWGIFLYNRSMNVVVKVKIEYCAILNTFLIEY